jgi:hypothetical protein
MNARKLLWGLPVAAAVGTGIGVDHWLANAAEGKQDLKPAVNLPMTRVVLFNSGVGYFSRSGEVEGEARVDLAFQDQDVNDLLKSMVLEDFGNGHIAAVSYDSREPISRTLSSFAINLNGNPTFASILAQARGERIEVTTVPNAANQPGKLTGAIVGIERQVKENAPFDVLNMWCAEGLRSVKLSEVQQLRFANPLIESEFRRALDVLALNHDSQKKSVSLHFSGDGKRKVQVGYVIEAPIWKTSYRLMLDGKGKEKPYIQGWAVVENPTDEDWQGVKMSLISGRPISFKMDLYEPLFVPRPTVEPELFASLRPPTYDGGFGFNRDKDRMVLNGLNSAEQQGPAIDSIIMNGNFRDQVKLRGIQQNWGNLPVAERNRLLNEMNSGLNGKQQQMVTEYFANFDRPQGNVRFQNNGLAFQNGGNNSNVYGIWNANNEVQIQQQLANFNPQNRMNPGAVGSAATGASLGDFFQYAIDHPVSLARQKSALLPIVGKDLDGTRVSIYNPLVQAKHPLLGLRLKNTSGLHLAQGPITVFEGQIYAGDTRVMDVQPNEERLVSYAIDLGSEVDPQIGDGSAKITNVKAVKGIVTTSTKIREVKKYRIHNRSPQDRQLIIEHPNRTNQQFKLVETPKPTEDTKDVYRFQIAVKAGEEKTFVVMEERDVATSIALSNSPDDQLKYFISLNEAPAALKAKLGEAVKLKGAWDSQKQDLAQVVADLARLNQDQDRIRKNLANTPKEAEVYQVYLKKLSDQEKEIDTLTTRQKKLMTDEFAAKKTFEDYLVNLTSE